MPKRLNTEEFIEKAKLVHGDKYDYSKVEYVNAHIKVCIVCLKHGEFWQTPNGHLSGKGCSKCRDESNSAINLSTTTDFISKAINIHGYKYLYNEVEYINNSTKVNIFCQKCNEFFTQTPQIHLSGSGCQKCGNEIKNNSRRSNKEEFIEKSVAVHGDKYSYDLVKYVNIKNKVKIYCKEHDFYFMQSPIKHYSGACCPKCSKTFMNTEYFIEKARLVHEDRYDYSKVDYKNSNIKVEIICKVDGHGSFLQSSNSHLSSKAVGCPVCAGNIKKTLEWVVESGNKIYGNKYDYSLVEYKNIDTKIKIICPEHGIFEQTPYSHINAKSGCPRCSGLHKTTSDFIEISNKKHNYKYDYSLSNYVNSETKIDVICPVEGHGLFSILPSSHMSGGGCSICGGCVKKTKDEFIKQAINKHGDYFDYSLVDYKGNKEKVKIICVKGGHGEFEQLPNNHLKYGCLKCSGNNKMTTDEFVVKANLKHRNKYDYSLVNYVNAKTKVDIICPVEGHGVFSQTAHGHLGGKGCSKCTYSRKAMHIKELLDIEGFDYIMEYRYDDCRNIKPLPFDFFIPSLNTCIEYNGEQHYKPVKIFSGEDGLESQKIRDKIKADYCKNNNIPLLIIKYDENVEEKLIEFGIINKKESV